MKLALVHDWFVTVGGAERALIELHKLWPHAPIYTTLYDPVAVRRWLPDAHIIGSSLQQWWRSYRYYPLLAPLMPAAVESFDLSGYDTVLSNSVSFSKGVIVRPDTRHVSYCYSPTRMLWDRATAYERSGVTSRILRHALRTWDTEAAHRPDELVAISQTAAARIAHYYRREARVIPPPALLASGDERPLKRFGTYLAVGRSVPHKNFELLKHAFERTGRPLTIASEVSEQKLSQLYRTCRALVVANEEDWGLTLVEAMSHGMPVIALRAGGATETMIEGVTGEFFDDAIPEAIADAVHRFEAGHYDPELIQAHAQQYGLEPFARSMRAIVEA